MAQALLSKVVAALPSALTADTVYYVRVGVGFDVYVTNHTGTVVAYTLNPPPDLLKAPVFADLFGDYVVSGLTTPTSATLSSTTAAGVAYVAGSRLMLSALARTYTSSKDTYVDLTAAGTYTYTEVANNAAAPIQAASTLRLARVVTSATAVTTVADLRATALALKNQLTVTADGAVQTTGTGQTGSVAGNARGTGAVDLQSSRATAARVASGTNAVIVGGSNNTASGTNSTILGGSSNTASGSFSVASGSAASAPRYGQRSHSSGPFATGGDAQRSSYVLRTATTDATATQLTLDGAAPSAQGRFALNAGQTIGFQGVLVAETANGALVSKWNVDGLISRGATAASTRLVGMTTSTQTHYDMAITGWSLNVTADTTNGALVFTVTGTASTSIRWVLSLLTSEVTF